ncbi:MAG TPA: glycosyltransferase family 4 protein [Vicinamibacterales bacterium]|nr:glycosyltransferase family 4 protein [Vicinamibacterales bacterium]
MTLASVLYFADTRFPIERANGLQTMATCQALAARGHDVTLVTRPDSAPLPRDPFEFYGLPRVEGLTLDTVPSSSRLRARRLRFLAAALAMTVRRGSSVIVYTRDLGLAALLLRLPASRRPRLVYESHGLAPVVVAERAKMLGSKTPPPNASRLARLDRQERLVWTRAAAYVTLTAALADDLAGRFGPRPEVFVVPDGAQMSSVEPEAGGLAASPAIVGYAGHLYPWKGVDVLVRALALTRDARGLIVGGHPGESDLDRVRKLIDAMDLGSRIEITGLVRPSEVAGRLRAASILVLPNTTSATSERYTSPLKLFEYLSLGRPIVASDFAAIREVLTDGETGLLVPADNPEALARAIERISRDRTLAAKLARGAIGLAPQYTWHERARRLEDVLATAARR